MRWWGRHNLKWGKSSRFCWGMCIKKPGKLISHASSVFRLHKCHVKWVCGRMAVNKLQSILCNILQCSESFWPKAFAPSELLPVLNYYLIAYSRGSVSAVSYFVGLAKSPFSLSQYDSTFITTTVFDPFSKALSAAGLQASVLYLPLSLRHYINRELMGRRVYFLLLKKKAKKKKAAAWQLDESCKV